MFELPELICFSRQMNQSLQGLVVREGSLGNSPHKFVWYNRSHDEFTQLTAGKTVGTASARGRWLFLPLEPGYVLVVGECGGKMLHQPAGIALPAKYHLAIRFNDDSLFTITTQMWGAMELYVKGEELKRQYIKDMRVPPLDPAFTREYFSGLVSNLAALEKRSAKSLLTQDQLIPGLGNSIAQDILFNARLNPRHPIQGMTADQVQALYDSIQSTVAECVRMGGRADEFDLHGKPGGYRRVMDKSAAGQPCPVCGTTVQSIQYLGGSCYFCPQCQV
jgi:formamidopyrimidine-DNA glycosylase